MDQRELDAMLAHDEHHWWYRGRRRVIAAELEQLGLPPGARILDAGCGSGRTLQELARFGAVSGVELDESAAQVARERGLGEVHTGRLEELPFEDGEFDLVTCLDVIEHTPDDVVTLRELRRVTKAGGHALITVPAYQSLWSAHDVVNRHFRRYNRRTLRAAATGAGWEVDHLSGFNSLLLAPAAAVRLARRRHIAQVATESAGGVEYRSDLTVGPSWLNGALERPLRWEAAWLRRGRRLPGGLSLLALLSTPAP
jgi:2-polyprenyl-3-methyl-5-hydroxy-6-metoxy-1,4-benzoquinol methylase